LRVRLVCDACLQCVQLLRELYAPVEIKLKENAFVSFNEYEQHRRSVIQTCAPSTLVPRAAADACV